MTRNADRLRHAHAALTLAWLVVVPVSLATGWISSLVFVSACSIYANAASHLAGWQASRAERSNDQ